MTISELLQHGVLPFEIPDTKMEALFSFFLHSAPTIESRTALKISQVRLLENWKNFLDTNKMFPSVIYAEGHRNLEKSCEINGLGVGIEFNRRAKGFICIRKGKESDYECVLRHIRNSVAHNNVFFCNLGNRKFVMLEDYNGNDKLTARILFSQTTLANLKKAITS